MVEGALNSTLSLWMDKKRKLIYGSTSVIAITHIIFSLQIGLNRGNETLFEAVKLLPQLRSSFNAWKWFPINLHFIFLSETLQTSRRKSFDKNYLGKSEWEVKKTREWNFSYPFLLMFLQLVNFPSLVPSSANLANDKIDFRLNIYRLWWHEGKGFKSTDIIFRGKQFVITNWMIFCTIGFSVRLDW